MHVVFKICVRSHFAELRQYTLSHAMSTAIRLIQMSNFNTRPGVDFQPPSSG